MRKLRAIAIDLACGVGLFGIAFGATRLLLHSRSLVYLFFPLLSIAAWGFGFWRGRARTIAPWATVALLNLPLLAALLAFVSRRDRGLWAMLIVTVAFSAVGVATRTARPGLLALVAANLGLALVVPAFVRTLVASDELREAAPPFVLRLVDGGTVSSAELRGRVVVLDFWATWCVPCRRELPEVDRLARRLANDPRIAFFAVDSALTDNPGDVGDTPELARAAFAKMGCTLPLAHSSDGALETAFGLHGFPALLVIDRAGRLRLRHVGFIESEDLAGDLERRLARLAAEGAD